MRRVDRISSVLHVLPQDRQGVDVHRGTEELQDVLANDNLARERNAGVTCACNAHERRPDGHQTASMAGRRLTSVAESSSTPASSTRSSSGTAACWRSWAVRTLRTFRQILISSSRAVGK